MQKKNIGVIFGGCSPEYGVSLESAHAVVSHMDKTKYQPVMIGISQAGDWFYYTGPTEKIEEDTSSPKILITKRGVGYYIATK